MHVLLMTHTHKKFQECIQPLKLNMWQVTDFEKKLFSLVIISVTKFMLPTLQLVFTASFSAVWTASTGALGILTYFWSGMQECNMDHSSVHVTYVAYHTIPSVQRMLQNDLGRVFYPVVSAGIIYISRIYLPELQFILVILVWPPDIKILCAYVSKDEFLQAVLQVK